MNIQSSQKDGKSLKDHHISCFNMKYVCPNKYKIILKVWHKMLSFFLSESATRKNKVDDQERKTIQPKAAIHANNSEFELISFFVLYVCIQTFSYMALSPLSSPYIIHSEKCSWGMNIWSSYRNTLYALCKRLLIICSQRGIKLSIKKWWSV